MSFVTSETVVPATPQTKKVLGAITVWSSTATTVVLVATIVPSAPDPREKVFRRVVVAKALAALANVQVVAVEDAVLISRLANTRVEVAEGDFNAQGVVVAVLSLDFLYSCLTPSTEKNGDRSSGPDAAPTILSTTVLERGKMNALIAIIATTTRANLTFLSVIFGCS